MYVNFSKKRCLPCEGIEEALSKTKAEVLSRKTPSWELRKDGKQISRVYHLKNFMQAVKLIHKIADIAEAENHHPDLHLVGYKNLTVELSTHAVKGLSENDFILAAKIDQLTESKG